MIPCPPHLVTASETLPEVPGMPILDTEDMSVDVVDHLPAIPAPSASTPTLMGDDTASETISKSSSAAGQPVADAGGRRSRSMIPGRKKHYRNRGFYEKEEHAIWRGNDKILSKGLYASKIV
jgi:hypothetical protein